MFYCKHSLPFSSSPLFISYLIFDIIASNL
nr:MAG TPA: hypothetical protein [Caudoviricetes sp.]